MQRRMPRVTALFHQLFRRLVLHPDLHDLRVLLMVLAEVGTHPALAVVNVKHGILLGQKGRSIEGLFSRSQAQANEKAFKLPSDLHFLNAAADMV
jgi:hypothetical protein